LKKDNIMTIQYTSGSTNLPKGVINDHSNYISQISSLISLGILN